MAGNPAWKRAAPGEKGRSGNPGGRAKLPKELVERCRELTPEIIKIWVDIARDKKQPAAARVAAGERIVERGYGKPKQEIDIKPATPLDDLPAQQLLELGASIASGLAALEGADPGDAEGPQAGALQAVH